MEDYYHAERLVSALYVLQLKKNGGIFCSKSTSDEITRLGVVAITQSRRK